MSTSFSVCSNAFASLFFREIQFMVNESNQIEFLSADFNCLHFV